MGVCGPGGGAAGGIRAGGGLACWIVAPAGLAAVGACAFFRICPCCLELSEPAERSKAISSGCSELATLKSASSSSSPAIDLACGRELERRHHLPPNSSSPSVQDAVVRSDNAD